MRNSARLISAACVIASMPVLSLAADAAADAPPSGPGLTDVLAASGVAVHGYVSAGYLYNSGLGNYRTFDVQHDSFDLHQAGLTVAYQPTEGFGGVVNVVAGHDAGLLNAYTSGGGSGDINLTQAFVQYASGSWTVMGGRFATLVGAEVINPTLNVNTSRSLLFNYEPLTHTGVRAVYAYDSTLSFTFGLNNGWDQVNDLNSQKTIEAGMLWAPSKAFTLGAQGYYGTEPAYAGGSAGARTIIDLVATWTLSDSLSLVLNYDYGSQEKTLLPSTSLGTASWQGVAGYLNYAIDDNWRVSLRAEYFDDEDGARTGTPQKLKEGTLTLAYAPSKAFEVRGELRADESDVATFLKPASAVGKSQFSVSLEGVFKF
ncbi:MAG: hypothetical protein RLZZ200_574 [Pseudomonadota bacterium]|jgi:hypothetical protein